MDVQRLTPEGLFKPTAYSASRRWRSRATWSKSKPSPSRSWA